MNRSLFCLGAAIFWAAPVEAQSPGAPAATPTATASAAAAPGAAPSATTSGPPGAAQIAEAQNRFRRALELHEEGNLDAARTELRRAYEIAPNFKVLYNLAQLEFELLDYPAALTTFEKYLNEGGDRIPKDRRTQVQNDIAKLRGRLGSIEIAVNVAGSRVAVDDIAIGTTPLLHPIAVSAGRRRITVSHAGYATETRLVDVAGGDHGALSFELVDGAQATPPAAPPAPAEILSAPPPPPVETPPPLAEPAAHSVPWVGWVATALLAGGAGVTGGLALQRSQRLASDRARYGIDPADLERLQTEATVFAVASDICAGSAAFAGLVSLYLTLSPSSERRSEQGRTLRVAPALGFVSVQGSF